MGKRLVTTAVVVPLAAFAAVMLAAAFVYFWRKRRRIDGPTTLGLKEEQESRTRSRSIVRYRPSSLRLEDNVRTVSQQPSSSQLTPCGPLVITPTSSSEFVIPSITSRPLNDDTDSYPTNLITSCSAATEIQESIVSITPTATKMQHKQVSTIRSMVKYHRALSEGSAGTRAGVMEEPRTPHGKIKLHLKHDQSENCLTVQILGKKGHSLHWFTGISNPYVRVSLISNVLSNEHNGILSSQILDLALNQKCQLDNITTDDINDCLLKFVVLDFDRFSRSEFVAEVMIVLSDLDDLSNGVTVCEDLLLQQKVMLAPRGSFLISLCNQSVAQQLQVIIIKADGVWFKGKELHVTTKLETETICYKRKIKGFRKNASYIFNEKLVFDVATGELTNTNLVLDVRKGDSKLLHETRLGYVKLGLDSDMALEIRHWSEMIASPQKQVAEWHQLHHR